MTLQTLSHRAILGDGAMIHMARATVAPLRPKALHRHDYTEVFWVQNGQVRHHMEGSLRILREGDLTFIPPGAAHALQGKGDHAMVVLLCLSPDLTRDMVARHPDTARLLAPETIRTLHRDPRQLAQINQTALRLERSARDALSAEAFLLPLCADLLDAPELAPVAPDWLTRACEAARDPGVFRKGAAGFVALTGKAHPHVSRTMKRHTGQSPVDYITGLRMDHAARALTGTSDPLAEIAEEIGIPNLSHFHKTFRARFGQTPAQYRARNQRRIVQP